MAAKAVHEAARAKAKKQKKLLLVLCVPLLVAVFYTYHTVSKLHQSSSATPPAATTTSTSTTSASAAPAATPPPAPPAGNVTSFALLPSRDPFAGGAQSSTATPVAPVTPPPLVQKPQPQPQQTQPKPKTQPKQTQPTPTQPTQTEPTKLSPPATRAVIVLDRTLLRIHLHKGFGYALGDAGQPFFWVLSLTRKTAKILVAGRARALTLKVDAPKTVSDLQGRLHTLMLLPHGTPLPAAVAQAGVPGTTSGSRGG